MASTKNKKFQAPIDEKETFVSLQKNFASAEDIEDKLKVLAALQAADNAIEKIVQLRGELPGEVAELEDEVASIEAKMAHVRELISGYEESIKLAGESITGIDSEIEKYQNQLGNIANSREYDSINKELENMNLERMICEKNIREAKESIQAKEAEVERLEEVLAARKDDLAIKNEELATIVESTSAEEKKLQATRKACADKIDERTISAYERIRNSVHNHLAVVPVYNSDSCGGCFSTITPQRIIEIESGKKLVICEHCGRILVGSSIIGE